MAAAEAVAASAAAAAVRAAAAACADTAAPCSQSKATSAQLHDKALLAVQEAHRLAQDARTDEALLFKQSALLHNGHRSDHKRLNNEGQLVGLDGLTIDGVSGEWAASAMVTNWLSPTSWWAATSGMAAAWPSPSAAQPAKDTKLASRMSASRKRGAPWSASGKPCAAAARHPSSAGQRRLGLETNSARPSFFKLGVMTAATVLFSNPAARFI